MSPNDAWMGAMAAAMAGANQAGATAENSIRENPNPNSKITHRPPPLHFLQLRLLGKLRLLPCHPLCR